MTRGLLVSEPFGYSYVDLMCDKRAVPHATILPDERPLAPAGGSQ